MTLQSNFKEIFLENIWGFLAVFSLSFFGILNQWVIAENSPIFWKNLIWHLAGLSFLIGFIWLIDYRKITLSIVWVCYILLTLILFILMIFKKRWIEFGIFSFQPGEYVKPVLILLISLLASKDPSPYLKFKNILKFLIIITIPLILILPTDLDYAVIMGVMFISFIIFLGVPKRILFLLSIVILIVGFIVFPLIWNRLEPHQKGRIYGYLYREKYEKTWSYQLNQALIAIGSGGVWGHGLKKGWSTRLHYLPAKHTDLSLAVWSETWGFIGVSIVLFLYAYLLYFGIKVSQKAKDWFGKYLCLGIILVLFWQAFFNIGGCTGLLPMTSIPFPFLSYGGSITISVYFLLSLVFNVSLRKHFFK